MKKCPYRTASIHKFLRVTFSVLWGVKLKRRLRVWSGARVLSALSRTNGPSGLRQEPCSWTVLSRNPKYQLHTHFNAHTFINDSCINAQDITHWYLSNFPCKTYSVIIVQRGSHRGFRSCLLVAVCMLPGMHTCFYASGVYASYITPPVPHRMYVSDPDYIVKHLEFELRCCHLCHAYI